ncbi:MAG: DUF6547 family protein [Verrucomicrobiota bacterium]
MKKPLDKFGEFIVQNLRDKMIQDADMLFAGKWKAPSLQALQKKALGLTEAQKQIVRDIVERTTVTGMHDLLFAIQEASDAGSEIKIVVDGKEVAKLSDGLHGEIFGDSGWIAAHSKYPQKK